MIKWNGRTVLATEPDLTIESDASSHSWGASCQGTSTGEPWSPLEKKWHINCLELLAVTLALKTFVKNNQGGTISKDLIVLTRDLWMWCLERNIHFQAQYLPGVMSKVADMESRSMKDRSVWKLDHTIFLQINKRYGPVEVDLFATRLTNQCRRYFSWWPDPFVEATEAFLQDWTTVKDFANPPWNLVQRVLTKTQNQGAEVILVAPVWKSQPWYPLMSLLVDWPRLLPKQDMVTESVPIMPQLASQGKTR